MIKQLFYISALLFSSVAGAQATFSSAGSYAQDFGTSTVSSWTDNSTFTGWYVLSWKVGTAGTNTFQGTTNITSSVPTNNGGWYMYQCNSGGDMKLGTRPSNASGGPDSPGQDGRNGIGLGLCLQNNLGAAINSMTVSFDWYQLSLAQNDNNTNTNFFSYYVSGSALSGSDLANSAHTYTSVASGNFTAPNDDPGPGTSSQLLGYPCTVGGNNSVCFTVTIPAASYIMLRWWDPNNSANDPHMAIDNVNVTAYSDNICTTVLPIELLSFDAKSDDDHVLLSWKTVSERNNNFFTVERASGDGVFEPVTTVNGNGTTSSEHSYSTIDPFPLDGNNYYRLRQTDFNGTSTVSYVVVVNRASERDAFYANVTRCETGVCYAVRKWDAPVEMKVYDLTGRLLVAKQLQPDDSGTLPLTGTDAGILIVSFVSGDHSAVMKIMH